MENQIAWILLGAVAALFLLPISVLSAIFFLIYRFKKFPLYYVWLILIVLLLPCLFMGFGVLRYAPFFMILEALPARFAGGITDTPWYLAKVIYGTVIFSLLIFGVGQLFMISHPRYKKKEEKERSKAFQQFVLNQWWIERLEKKLKEQEHHNGVFLGIDMKTRKPIVLGDEELNQHTFLAGTTGSGKTTTIETFVAGAVRANKPIILIDGKGDSKFARMAYSYAKEYQLPFRYFSLSEGEHVWHYNPLAHGNYSELKDRLMAMGEWGSEPFFKGRGARYLQIELKILKECGMECDLENVIKYMEPSALTLLVRQITDKSRADYYLSVIDSFDPQHIQSTVDQIAAFTESNVGELFKEKPGQTIRLFDAMNEGGITLFSLDSLRYPEAARSVGKLILTDLKAAAAMHRESSAKPVSAIFDEFNVYASTQVVDFINKSRSAGFEALISTQSLADIDIVDPYLCKQIIQNCNTVIIQRQNESDDAERLAATIGTEDTARMTYQTDDWNIFNEKTGRGSMRITKEFIVHPDEIKRLGIGEAVILRKTPVFKVQRTKVVLLGKTADKIEGTTVNPEKQEAQRTTSDEFPDVEWFVLSKKNRKA